MKKIESEEIIEETHSQYRTIQPTHFFGGVNGMHFEVLLSSIQLGSAPINPAVKPKRIKTLETRLVLDPFTAKDLCIWLQGHITTYEKKFGNIPTAKDLQPKD